MSGGQMKTTSHTMVEYMVFAACLAVVAGTAFAADWPCFRGPNRDGISSEVIAKLPPTLAWSATVGSGYSQVVVSGGRVYTVGAGSVYCFSETTGSGVPLWTKPVAGGYSTPAVDGTNLYVLSGKGNLTCLDTATGTTRWSASLKGSGYNATSPLIEGNLVILNIGSRGTAVNKNTGAVVWGNDASGGIEGSPIVLTRSNQRTILSLGKYGVDPATGNIMWALPTWGRYPDLIFNSDRVWTGTSVTNLNGGNVWSRTDGDCFGCHVLYGGHLYGPTANGFKCIEFATGVEKWGVPFAWLDSWATVILAKDQLIVLSPKQDGCAMGFATSRLVVINATPAGYQEVYRMEGVVSDLTCPTLANGRLYLRNNAGTLVCYDVSGGTNWNGVQVYPSLLKVAEGSSATFRVRLAKKPVSAVTVTTARTGGDTDLTVQSGTAMAFTPDNWSEWQTVTLAAGGDADTADGAATFTCTAPGLDAATVTATEMDSDTSLTTLSVLSGGNGATLPNGATSVTRRAATTIIATPAAAHYKFSNWTVTSGEAVFGDFIRTSPTNTVTIAAPATIHANFQYNGTNLTVLNDGHGTTVPSGATLVGAGVPFVVSATPNTGYAFLNWTTRSGVGFGNVYSASTTVTTAYGGTIQATFTSCKQAIVASIETNSCLLVPKVGTFTFYVKLMAPPVSDLTVTVERTFGDTAIAVAAGSNLTFSAENWSVPQPVTLTVAKDNDTDSGRTRFTCSAPGWTSTTVMVGR